MTYRKIVSHQAEKYLRKQSVQVQQRLVAAIRGLPLAGLTGFLASRASSHTPDVNAVGLQGLSSAFGSTFLLIAGIAAAGALLSIALREPRTHI